MIALRAPAAVWAVTVLGVVLALTLTTRPDVFSWLALTLTLAVVAGMVAQLVVGEQHGFVLRLAITACGSFALVALGGLVALALG